MFDHFGILAPFYERVIAAPDVSRLSALLELPAAGRLLDAGGGTGRVSSQLRPMVDELIVTDVSYGMLAQAQAKSGLALSQAHAETLPFADDAFERVLVVDALHHFCDQSQAVAELLRVLKRGGTLVIEEPDLNSFKVKLVALGEKLALMRSHFYYPAEIKAMVEAHGGTARIETDGDISAWVVVNK
jgi:demethylmenaquinone methyltransferase/2-methoxy-6-polyprenyl-1,4-benzoquinol methylase